MTNEKTYPTTIHVNIRFVPERAELVIVVAQQPDGLDVVASHIVVPCHRVDAGVREILMSRFAEQSKECHLSGTHRIISDLFVKNSFKITFILSA